MSSITDPQVRAFLTERRRTSNLSFLASVASWWRVQPTKVLAVSGMTG